MQKSSLMAWVGGTVRANQVLVPSIRCGKAFLSFPVAGAVLPDGDYVISGVLQLDGQDPVLLPLAYAAHCGDAFLRLAGEVVGGKVLQRDVGLPDGSFHSQVISWGDRLLLADSRFEAAPTKTTVEQVTQPAVPKEEKPADGAAVTSAATATPAAETPKASSTEPSVPKEQTTTPEAASKPPVAVQGELPWEPSSRTSFSGEEMDQVSLTVPMGKTLKWPVTNEPCPPLEGEVGKAIVQAAPVSEKSAPEKSVPTLRKSRRKANDLVEPSVAEAPASTAPAAETREKVRNLDGLDF
jgi:hypothetical protein